MPGTVHVTVLEFKGVSPSSPKPSAKSLKVSMGKRQYQTWDKGDFSFPISKIRENLVVALLDAGGNEIAHQDIRTIQIIEKGSWDEVFSINGGGHVHLKLHFSLSDEDRDRIRVMRESAMKKKLETNPNIKLRLLESATSVSESVEKSIKDKQLVVSASTKGFVDIDLTVPKVEASRAGSSPPPATSSVVSLPSEIPNATDGSQVAPSSPVKHEIGVESAQVPDENFKTPDPACLRPDNEDGPSSKLPSTSQSDKNNFVAHQEPQKEGPVEKKNPSNVRKMISAFENTKVQDVKSMKRAASVPAQLNRFRKESLLEDQPTKSAVSPFDKASIDLKDRPLKNIQKLPTTEKELPTKVPPALSEGSDLYTEDTSRASSHREALKEGEESTVDKRRESASETATSSGRMSEEQSQVPQPNENSSRLLKSSESSVAEGSGRGRGRGRGRGTGLKSSTMNNSNNQVASKPKPKTIEYCTEEYDSDQSSGMWIFPDNTSRLCITTAGKQVTNEAKIHQANNISSETQKNLVHEKEHKIPKKADHPPESGSVNPPNDSSNRLFGQVIKVAVIVGFGVLVLLTRQKEPRKKEREDKGNLFHIPEYVDERTLKPWTGKQ